MKTSTLFFITCLDRLDVRIAAMDLVDFCVTSRWMHEGDLV